MPRVYQDLNGLVGSNKAVLVPPLVRVREMAFRMHGSPFAVPLHTVPGVQVAPADIFLPKGLPVKGFNTLHFMSLQAVFRVSPARRLKGIFYQGHGGSLLVDHVSEGMEFSMKQTLPLSPDLTFYPVVTPHCNIRTFHVNLTIPDAQSNQPSIPARVRFVFDDVDMQSHVLPVSLGSELWNHGESKDMTVVTADGVPIKMHRAVLVSQSAFFSTLLCGPFKETQSTTFTAEEGSAAAWNNLVRFLYDRRLHDHTGTVLLETMHLGYYYSIPALVACAWAALSQPLSKRTAVEGMRLAHRHGDTVIGRECWIFIKRLVDQRPHQMIRDVEFLREYSAMLEEIGGIPRAWAEGVTTEEYDMPIDSD